MGGTASNVKPAWVYGEFNKVLRVAWLENLDVVHMGGRYGKERETCVGVWEVQ